MTTKTILFASLVFVASISAFAQAPAGRLSDKEIKALIDQVDEGRDKFEGNLDGKFKGATLRGPTGEAKVAGVLQDYQDSTAKLKERFTADYSASAEVGTVLKQSTGIDAYMKTAQPTMKGRSEWDQQAANLKRLAEAYGATFPLVEGAAVRRLNDKETAALAAAIGTAADRFKKDIDADKTLAKPDKEAGKKDVELLVKHADTLRSRTSEGKPATSELGQLVVQAAKVQAFVEAHPIPAASNWQAVQASVGKLQQAFHQAP